MVGSCCGGREAGEPGCQHCFLPLSTSLGPSGIGEAGRAYGSLIDGETEVRDVAVREKMRRVW